jgi:sugar lactone lactonase YvrE
VADEGNHRIRKIDSNGEVTTIAGSSYGYADGTGTNAQFSSPRGVAIDNDGAIIVADTYNHRIRKIDSNGEVSTIAGSTEGYADGTGTNAQFRNPYGVAIDNDGSIIVADSLNDRIRKIDSNGEVSTIAGSTEGYADGTGTNAQFNGPNGVAIDNDGAIIVADKLNDRIRKIDSNGEVSTIAGSTEGYADGTGTNAQFNGPNGVAIDNDGAIIVVDIGNHLIRKIDNNGYVTTIAGSLYFYFPGYSGNSDGIGRNAQFWYPKGVVIDNYGSIIVVDGGNNRIRKMKFGYLNHWVTPMDKSKLFLTINNSAKRRYGALLSRQFGNWLCNSIMIDRQNKEEIKQDILEKVVLITGPHQTGKTTLSKSLVANYEYINYDEIFHRKIMMDKTKDITKENHIFL